MQLFLLHLNIKQTLTFQVFPGGIMTEYHGLVLLFLIGLMFSLRPKK